MFNIKRQPMKKSNDFVPSAVLKYGRIQNYIDKIN